MVIHRILSLPLLLSLAVTVSPAAESAKPLTLEQTHQIAARIDQFLENDLAAAKLPANEIVPDDVFLRRSYLAIVGRIPTPREALRFLDLNSPHKRSQLVEKLVSSPGYESSSFNYFADLLRVQSGKEQYGLGWHVWLRKSIAEDKPWNQMVHEMLASNGHSAKDPAAGYYLRDRGMLLDNVSNSMQVFLGHQIGCAQCHDHPFDRWTQLEYYELASFSSGIQFQSTEARKAINRIAAATRVNNPPPKQAIRPNQGKGKGKGKGKNNANNAIRKLTQEFRPVFNYFNRNEISDNPKATLKLPEDYQYEDGDPGEIIPPATIFGDKLRDVPPEQRREAFADWVTSGNPYFAKVFANRLWKRTFGHGLVDPVDDWSKEAKTAHPELLAYLAEIMPEIHYRTRDFERILYHTNLFQRAAAIEESTPGTVLTFQGPQLRRMRAEEIYDSLLVLTYGDVDENINTALEDRWIEYQQELLALLSASPKELTKIKETIALNDKQKIAFQKKNTQLALQIRKANNRGDRTTAQRLRSQLDKARKQYSGSRNAIPLAFRRNLTGNTKPRPNMRASEYPTPFKADHLVRQFGGSDREISESTDSLASIPQALTLLNGRVATTTDNRKSKIFEALAEISNDETRLEFLFLAFYSSRPTPQEVESFLPLASDREGIFTLARAMLTSKRFLFVQ